MFFLVLLRIRKLGFHITAVVKKQSVLHQQLKMEEVPCNYVLHFKWIYTGIREQLNVKIQFLMFCPQSLFFCMHVYIYNLNCPLKKQKTIEPKAADPAMHLITKSIADQESFSEAHLLIWINSFFYKIIRAQSNTRSVENKMLLLFLKLSNEKFCLKVHMYLKMINGEEVPCPIWFPKFYYKFQTCFSASGYYIYYMDWSVICFSP